MRSAADLGFRVTVIHDAVASFNTVFGGQHFDAQTLHKITMAGSKNEFAEVISTMDLLENLQNESI